MDNSFLLDGFKWSFSRINSYAQCPRQFYMQYIEVLPQVNNAFSQWGSFGHELLADYYLGKKEFFELSEEYQRDYEKYVTLSFPPNTYKNLDESYYEAGKLYFDNFEGDFSDYEILGVEEYMSLEIDGYTFIGYIDLILRNEDGIVIVDHKSKSKFASKRELNEYLRQLYLYSIHIKEKHGEYPTKLIFNLFRNNEKVIVDFDNKKFADARKWFVDNIKYIYEDKEFIVKPDEFFCNYLCSVGHHCPCSNKFIE